MLETYLKPVLSKHRGVALGVWGEAGIGKSYTVASVLKTLPCHTLSLHATTPLQSFVGQLTKPKKLAIWADKTLERVQKGEQVETSNLISAMAASLSGLAPFVLHLEDMHEADPARLEFIRDLAQTVQKLKGVGLLVTSRQLPSEPFMAVKLESLSREDSDKLLENELKATLPKEALDWIYAKVAGNPLFTLEYVRFLARQGFLCNNGKSWYWRKPEKDTLPAVVEVLLEQMIEQAKTLPMHRYVLETKALLPLDASDELWEKVARVSSQDLQTTRQELSTQGIFKGKGFAHPLVREVALKTLSSERRRDLSRRAINALGDDPVQAALFVEDAKLDNDKALGLFKGAAAKAEERNKLQAARFLAKAVDFATGEEKGELALRAAQLSSTYSVSEAAALAERASTNQPSSETFSLWSELLAKDNQLPRALEVARRLGQEETVQQLWCIYLHSWAGEHAQAVTLWEQFCQSHPQEHLPATVGLKTVGLEAIVFSLTVVGHFLAALELAQQGLKYATSLEQQAQLLRLCGQANSFFCDYPACYDYYEQALSAFEELGDARQMGITLYRTAMLCYYQCELDRATTLLHKAQTHLASTDAVEILQVEILLATIDIERGHYETAEQVMLECRDRFLLRPLSSELVDLEIRFCYLYRSWKTPHSALLVRQFAGRAWQWAKQLENQRLVISATYQLARGELFAGDANKGLALAEEALHQAQQLPFPIIEAYAHHAVFQAKQALGHQNALAHLGAAVRFFQEKQLLLDANFYALELACLTGDWKEAKRLKSWLQERNLHNMLREDFLEVLGDTKEKDVLPLTKTARLELLGSLQISRNGTVEKLRGSKRQEFIALLLEARICGHAEVSRLELFDKLYSSEDELKATNNLKDLIHVLRENLGANAITTTATGYALGSIDSDAEQFLKTGDTNLWRGSYLEGLAIETQEAVSESLYLMLFEKVKELLEIDSKESSRLARILLEYDPYNHDYLTLCLQALRASNNHKSLTRLYTEATERFLEVGEKLPQSWQTFLQSN
jgi:AAA ATPase domain